MGGERIVVISFVKDEFFVFYCYRKKGTNFLVLIGSEENVVKIL